MQHIEFFFYFSSTIIGFVNGAGERDEIFAEVLPPFAVADVILNLPQRLVDALQFRHQAGLVII